jgi:hypothetical protein
MSVLSEGYLAGHMSVATILWEHERTWSGVTLPEHVLRLGRRLAVQQLRIHSLQAFPWSAEAHLTSSNAC